MGKYRSYVRIDDADARAFGGQLRQLDTNNARFITVTGYGQCKDKDRALAAGLDVHFTKPVNPQVLRETIHAASATIGKN